jgi:hypothetical protein
MRDWRQQLKYDPVPALLDSGSSAIQYFAKRELLEERVGPASKLWQSKEAARILKKQLPDGSWPRPGETKHPAINYGLIETWRQLRHLVAQHGFTGEHPQIQRSVEFVFSCQTDAGDIRGFLANQYATYYTGALLAVILDAGYEDDSRVERGLQWLLNMRQDDGGWTIPLLTHHLDAATQYRITSEQAEPLEPDRSQPFSHNWTGMVLRAFASHRSHRRSPAARKAAELLKSRFFQPDVYTSYEAASYWIRFDYPFWWNNLVAALDSITLIGLPAEDEQIQAGLSWLIEHQQPHGLWRVSYVKGQRGKPANEEEKREWISLAICRILKRVIGTTND